MRERTRISELCDLLMVLWQHNCPDMRFGQLMCCLDSFISTSGKDIFYVEDEDMKTFMVEFFDKLVIAGGENA